MMDCSKTLIFLNYRPIEGALELKIVKNQNFQILIYKFVKCAAYI